MKSVLKHLSFSNVLASVAIFFALGGSAYAIGKNSIGSAQLKKNAVTAAKIKKNAVTAAKIRNNAITSAKIRNGAITGTKIADGAIDGSKLAPGATVGEAETAKSAETADVAQNLAGQETFFLRLQTDEQKTIAKHGAVSLYAKCSVKSGSRYIEVFGKTDVDGAILSADYDLNGGSSYEDFLNTDTPEADRIFEYESGDLDYPYVDSEIDSGFVLDPNGKGLVANTEGMILGLNYAGADCIVGGVVNKVG